MKEIRLYGPIGGYYGYTADEILSQIPEDETEIRLRIHSPGGSVGEGLAIYNALRDHPASVECVVDGYAASSASFVMLAGDTVKVHKSSMVFVHNPWTYAEGNSSELRKTADDLDQHTKAIMQIYTERTGKTESEIKDWMENSTFFVGTEARDAGFANAVIDDEESNMEIAANLNLEAMFAARKMKGENMTATKTRKEIAAERDELKAESETQQSKIAEMSDTLNELMDAVNAMKAERDKANAEAQELKAAIEKIESEKAEFQDKMNAAVEALKNPAFADAALKIVEETDGGGETESDADDPENEVKRDFVAEYDAITDPREKTEFWRENQNDIIKQMKDKGE